MTIQEMFVKPITREVKGVIKVGQGEDANVKQELEEYVVTRELQKHIARFFEAYKKSITGNTDNMGVWISGFFGSGKSHFLKILSYLLENREVDGKHAIDYFVEDHKIDNGMVLADMRLAADTSADVILFNIDSKSEMGGKQDKEAILSVFLKVFNEMQGFYGANPHIADLERNLSYDGRYEEFKEKFEEANGDPWTEARNEFDYSQDDVVDVLVDMGVMTEEAARNLCEKAFTPYPKSIEDFAKMVKKYAEKKGKNHHIVFLVDEIGQYIGADPGLMLNLQTVTEDLGTACQGKAWIVVTSQQDIDSVVKVKGNDFSKIMGRFNTRLSLSSANVDEVIKKRILEKTPVAAQTLEVLYEDKATTLKNLISFNDGIEKKLYSSKENFAEVYPFVPYQFNLLGDVLTQIRTHGASGKSLADGARSMLALFKESAERIMDKQPGTLVPFHFFYDALEQFIEHNHRDVITRALDNDYINPDHEKENFSVNVLKVLFMIKYVNTIKANKDNIASLMVSDVNDDRLALIKKVEDALDVLERQGLIQKTNEGYVFLTNEEQEIQRMIERQQVDLAEINAKIAELIFDGTFTDKKYRYPAFNGRYAFAFNQVVDDRPYKGSTGHDLTLRIITPNSDDNTDEATLRLMSGQSNVVLVVLPEDRAFINEIAGSLKIEKFLRLDATNTVSKYEEIKAVKRGEMREHNSNARTFLNESLRSAELYVAGDRLQSSAKEISSKINEALAKLVDMVYHKLSYITAAKGEADVRSLIQGSGAQIKLDLGNADAQNQLALNDVRDYIAQNTSKHMKTSMKTLMDRFTKAPYGFIEDDVEWLVAKLYKDGDIALFVNNEAVTTFSKSVDDIVRYITRKEFVEKLMTEKKEKPSPVALKTTRDIMKKLFNITSSADNEEDLMKSFLGYAKGLKQDLEKMDIRYQTQPKYPGKQVVSDGKKLLNSVLMLDYTGAFYKKILEDQDAYLDFAEDYEPLKTFFEGDQKTIFDKSLKYMAIYDDSKTFIADQEIYAVSKEIKEIQAMEKPFSQIYRLPGLNDKFEKKYMEILESMAQPIYAAIDDAKKRVLDELEGKQCENVLKPRILSQFKDLQDKAEQCNNVARLQNIKVEADALKIRLLNNIAEEERRLTPPPKVGGDTVIHEPQKKNKTISIKSINTATTWQLETEEDVDKYLKELRGKLISKLEENTIVNIELIAVRFMEVNDYLPSHIRVLSSENEGKLEPDFVTTPFDTDLEFSGYERDLVYQLKDENKLDELFRMLFIKQCNKLSEILPGLFEQISDYTELLLNISFTDKDGIVYHLTHCINTASNRVEPEEIEWIREFTKENQITQVPIIIVLTQSFSEKNAEEMKKILLEENLDVVQVVPVLAEDYVINREYTVKAFGLDTLIRVMGEALPDELADTLQNVQIASLDEKKRRAQAAIATATLAAATECAVPVPLADCALLIPTQLGMIASITVIFGFDVNKSILTAFLSSTLGAGGATLLGKTIVANLLKIIPGIGSAAGAAISASTAGIITAALGEAYIGIMTLVFSGEMNIADLSTQKGKEKMKEMFVTELSIRK